MESPGSSTTLNTVHFTHFQESDCLYIKECTPSHHEQGQPITRASDSVRRLVVLSEDRSVTGIQLLHQAPAGSAESRSQHLNFCIPCSARFPDQPDFVAHCQSVHCTSVADPCGAALVLLSEQSLRHGIPMDVKEGPSDLEVMQRTVPSNSDAFPLDMKQMVNGDFFKFMRSHPLNQTSPIFLQRNSSKTLKCPKCNWHYKYQETLEIHMKEKHSDSDVSCVFCLQNQPHPKLARGESYSCGYKPYRCELCKYSTTTKGNLSIHMQSDKHLHAVQEMPGGLNNSAVLPGHDAQPDKLFSCLVCNSFVTNSCLEMVAHIERDRSRLFVGDVSVSNGFYHCHLCPYNTNLKANFQLHTRTDKHMQRVHLVNHMRESCAPRPSASALVCRLGAFKSVVQVRCGVCQEVLSGTSALREHAESRLHLARAAFLLQPMAKLGTQRASALATPIGPGPTAGYVFECKTCPFLTDEQNLALCQWSSGVASAEWTANAERLMSMGEVAFYCKQCDFLTGTLEQLQTHEQNGDHQHVEQAARSAEETCPLCMRSLLALREHLLEEHNIVDQVADKLMASSAAISNVAKDVPGLYRHRCPHCPLVFKHAEQLQQHQLTHTFRLSHRCPQCQRTFQSVVQLLQHQQDEHAASELACELCQARFADRAAFDAHFASVDHLHRTKQYLEGQPGKLQLNEKVMQLLSRQEDEKLKPFKCNVCKQSYAQGSTLDIHLRSVAHQSRMSRLTELVRNNDIDATKPVSEQPGGIPQKVIGELVDESDAPEMNSATESPVNFMNMLNMAQFMQFAQNPSTSSENQIEVSENGELDLSSLVKKEDRPKPRKLGQEFRKSLEGYGFELVSQFFEHLKREKIDYIPDNEILELKQQFDDINKNSVPLDGIQRFAEHLNRAVEAVPDAVLEPDSAQKTRPGADEDQPLEKRPRPDSKGSAAAHAAPNKQTDAVMNMMAGFPFNASALSAFNGMTPDMFQAAFASMFPMSQLPPSVSPIMSAFNTSPNSPQKRARTRITDEQLKVLRQYFDINNSPTESQIKEMSVKAGLPEKVIKHWFRNTLFKERQRDKNSPYNFSVQPMMRIDLDTYEKTGEAKIIPIKPEEEGVDEEREAFSAEPDTTKSSPQPEPKKEVKAEEEEPEAESSPPDFTQEMLSNLSKAAAAFSASGLSMNSYAGAIAAASMAQSSFASLLGQAPAEGAHSPNPLAQLLNGFSAPGMPGLLGPTPPQPARPATSAAHAGTGRRANRTRFTDFQLRTLQEFFDKQAYPKDDDLEMLSKKLSLSPRVIVVWFQNARQKARKIYENQPNQDNTDRFIRTPGCNFQCKRCQLVFQRYYELIQHQQRVCYSNDSDAQHTDNKSVEENMSDEERQNQQRNAVPVARGSGSMEGSGSEKDRRDSTDNNNSPHDILKLLAQGKGGGDALLSMFSTGSPKASGKRCAMCAQQFGSRDQLQEHVQRRHADQSLDLLPAEADEATAALSTTEGLLGTISALTGGSPLDLSQPSAQHADADDSGPADANDDFSSNGSFDLRALSASPHALLSAFGGPSLSAVMGGPGMQQRSPANAGGSKRYRTHLTPLQVFVMKSLFADYKTPSMSECEVLGHEIGLHKRVVQVWFQNARAKQRKCGPQAVQEEGLCATTPAGCPECGVEFNGRSTVQDHIFTAQHIGRVKQRGAELRGTAAADEPERARPAKRSADEANGVPEESGLNQMLYSLMDPNVIGTPIQCLQIPEAVMAQISADLAQGNPSTTFTQDGLTLADLNGKVGDDDFKCATSVESEVGWACPQCSQVFQQEAWLRNHQRLLCTSCDQVFRLIQQHYECIPCAVKFGTQDDFRLHCEQAVHQTKRKVFHSPSSCSTGSV